MGDYNTGFNTRETNDLKSIVLSRIPTRPTGVNSKDIARQTGINSRDVRFIIQMLRDDGEPICGTPNEGYWIAQYSDELNGSINKLKSQITTMHDTLDSLCKIRDFMRLQEMGE